MALESKEQRFTLRCRRSQLYFAFDTALEIEFVKATSCLSVSSFLSILCLPIYLWHSPIFTFCSCHFWLREVIFFFFFCWLKLVRHWSWWWEHVQHRSEAWWQEGLTSWPGFFCTCTVQSLMELWALLLLPPSHQCNINNNHTIFSLESLKLCCFNTVCRSWQNRLCFCSHGCGVLDEIFS